MNRKNALRDAAFVAAWLATSQVFAQETISNSNPATSIAVKGIADKYEPYGVGNRLLVTSTMLVNPERLKGVDFAGAYSLDAVATANDSERVTAIASGFETGTLAVGFTDPNGNVLIDNALSKRLAVTLDKLDYCDNSVNDCGAEIISKITPEINLAGYDTSETKIVSSDPSVFSLRPDSQLINWNRTTE